MKNTITLIIILLCITVAARGQSVPSDCIITQETRDLYNRDAHMLALKYIRITNSSDTDSALIRTTLIDTMLEALTAVHNASLPERDTVIDILRIHSNHAPGFLQMLNVMVWDRQSAWASELERGIFPTSSTDVNALIGKYRLQQKYVYSGNSFISFDFESDTLFNMHAVAKQWDSIPGTSASAGFLAGDGDYILLDTLTATYTDLVFSHGWGDCPAGCISRRNWYFRVYRADCSVEFIKSTGSDLKTGVTDDITGAATRVFPNPFTDYIYIPEAWQGAAYTLVNTSGQIVAEGRLPYRLETASVPAGIYHMQVSTGKKQEIIRLLKR